MIETPPIKSAALAAWGQSPGPACLALALLCLALYLPGLFALPAIDRDEARYAQASRQMVRSGDYVRIHFQEKTRYKKPVGIYWLQSLAVHLTGRPDSIWPYRLPSLLGALAAVLLLYLWGRRLCGGPAAFWAAALLAGSLLLVFVAHQATTDAALLAAIVAGQGALGFLYLRESRGEPPLAWPAAVFWAAQGAAALIKGPMGPFVSLATLAGLWLADGRPLRREALRPLPGLGLALVIAAPWFIAVTLANQGAFWKEALGVDLLPKLAGGQESHGAPPLYYLVVVALAFWPGNLVLFPALVRAWRERMDPVNRFLLAWAGPTWLLLELAPTKLPHYILPVFPALALLAARALWAGRPGEAEGPRGKKVWLGRLPWVLAPVALALGGVGLPLLLDRELSPMSLLPLAGALGLLAFAWLRAGKGAGLPLLAASLLASLFMFGGLFQGVLPNLKGLWLSQRAHEMVREQRGPAWRQGPPVPTVGYHEPSLVFHLGVETPLVSAREGARLLAAGKSDLALVTADKLTAFTGFMAEKGLGVRPLTKARAQHYTKGKWFTLYLLEPCPLFLEEARRKNEGPVAQTGGAGS